MPSPKKVFAICGSTRASSSNLNLIKAIADLTQEQFIVQIFTDLSKIPHFNPDLDNDTPPSQVSAFREQLRASDGILICTPEYAMGVPGSLKNAIDWTVSSMEFYQKPTALITASSVGEKGHRALLETLVVIEAKMLEETKLVIPFVRTKVSADCKITDAHTLVEVQNLIQAFAKLMDQAT
ncbi:NADPH-dependent FMN reductase [Haliscomenobacter hydrossis]|uniref:NADPH-dependent FMN reductase n=1 Tax=Haliscomenobacter hydrossis (strain ATCC 27775 / DSM 1100 / LMG 10767 / O) TaxID=760192 RepID=F4L1D2_HALH1|nr:NADPH-dependent FMN reductase [Haliscomenobacter hydrossis]AEE53829.1 NADPH-dependent FMN reductase [Haliscomenobacter hydrossis DSM 1100]